MLAVNNQYKPTTYGVGMTQQQLNNLYGTNPSLVTQNFSRGTPAPDAAFDVRAQGGAPMTGEQIANKYNMNVSDLYQTGAYNKGVPLYGSYGTQVQTNQVPQGYYGYDQANNRYYTEGASAENETAAANREQMGLPAPTTYQSYTPPTSATPGWNKLSAEQQAAIYGQQNANTLMSGPDGLTYGYTLDKSGNKVWGSAGNEWMQTPDMPMEMSWEDALGRAGESVNPIYDSLRSRAEMEMYDTREALPQLLAARHGMAGTRGGRIASAYTDQTQKEAATMQDIEGRRQGATAEMAQAIKSMDDERAMRIWQESNNLALQKQQLMLQLQSAQTDDWARRAQVYMQMQGFSADEAQRALENDPLFWKNQMDVKRGDSDLAYKQASTQALLNEQDPEHWKNQAWMASNSLDDQYKKAQIAGLYSRPSGGGGGGGSSGGSRSSSGGGSSGGGSSDGLNYNTALIRASELARADPRLADGEMNIADGTNYFSLPQLVDAYMTMLAYGQ